MIGLIGEYECKLDNKGRLSLPSKLRAQLPAGVTEHFVLNRGFEKCLVLYTKENWLSETNKLNEVDDFMSPAVRKFKRLFTNGASLVNIDSANRILIGKNLAEYAEISIEVVVIAYNNLIEIWSKANYANELAASASERSDLAQDFYKQRQMQRNLNT